VLQVIQAFVRQAMSYMDATPDKETLVSLIKTLQTVTEGKVRRSCSIRAVVSAVPVPYLGHQVSPRQCSCCCWQRKAYAQDAGV
jgi:hypothetical protein